MTAFAPRSTSRNNRRRQPRLDVDAPARLLAGTSVLEGRIENISSGGASFLCPQIEPALPIGAKVTLVAPGVGEAGADLECASHVIRTDVLCDASGELRVYALAFDRPFDAAAETTGNSAPAAPPQDADR